MKKIGIITHYFGSRNYGGVLQAYALTRMLTESGYDCEQICYDTFSGVQQHMTVKVAIAHYLRKILFERKWKQRNLEFEQFRERIPHSETVYSKYTIAQCADDYDVYVTGSDQVWNLKAYHAAYFLDFVPSSKCKLSYAASLCTDFLDEAAANVFRKHLCDYTAISVREENSVELLFPLVSKQVNWVVDPVFLLTRDQWDELASDRLVQCRYVFCYFLGNDGGMRKLARQYARQKHLKLVTIPHVRQAISKDMFVDFGFGDIRLHVASPEQFVSLIKNADVIFTDSFHAVSFSVIYKKEFFVFERAMEEKMSSRIQSIAVSSGTGERFCVGERRNLAYLLGCAPIDYGRNDLAAESFREASVRFLLDNIG